MLKPKKYKNRQKNPFCKRVFYVKIMLIYLAQKSIIVTVRFFGDFYSLK
jgi:hypothetical protein